MGTFSRLTSIGIILVVLFTQVGAGLLHTHQGVPSSHQVALTVCPESDTVPCSACALEGTITTLALETHSWSAPTFSSPDFGDPSTGHRLLAFADQALGRAPPVC